ncbi:MAG: hypothetical protein WC895_04135 [Candidatus Shapirobacteria bacterium]|jgi:hypothetical protein
MALRDHLNLVSAVSVIKSISTNDGMGGFTSTASTTILSLAALWQNSSVNRFVSDRYEKNSTHQLVFEYGAYTFNNGSTLASTETMIETVSYDSKTYKTVGYADNVMDLNEIVIIGLERII